MSRQILTEHAFDLGRGIVGGGATVIGTITSLQEQLEWGLRLASLIVGIAVGLVTIWSILRRNRRG